MRLRHYSGLLAAVLPFSPSTSYIQLNTEFRKMATAAWDREKAYADWEELLKRATNPDEADKM